jgi:hypothetical protein
MRRTWLTERPRRGQNDPVYVLFTRTARRRL